ncbi:autotransporter domain-containing protein [Achromobacter xylosoxidans]|uniref:autotransporter domain-containing protein n=1 Tax=Alcaligenes xylosoxydans xylosoxydans TaxID=85698 RepID=UPI00375851B1
MRTHRSLPIASRLALSILTLSILAACGGGGGSHGGTGGSLPGTGGGGGGGPGGAGTVAPPVKPADPVTPPDPATPADPVAPPDPAKPADPVTPPGPAKPADPVTPPDPATPADPVTPPDPAKPADPVTPPGPAKPADPVTPPDPATPADPVAPPDPPKPAPVVPISDIGIPGWRPTSPVPAPPDAAAFDGAGVNVGVIDNGFDADPTTDHHKLSVAGALREVLAPDAAEPVDKDGKIATHGAIVSRIIGGQVVAGDDFGKGVATGVNLYQANQRATVSNLSLRDVLSTLNARGVKIVNNSWSFVPGPEYALPDGDETKPDSLTVKAFFPALDKAVNSNGQLLVWASGNESQPNPYLLAAAPRVVPTLERGWLTVTQVLADGDLATWSNACGIAANWCLSARSPDDDKLTGTSFAAPVVAATAALVSQAYPWMDNSALRQTLLSTADDMGDRARFGWGRLNMARALRGPALFDTRLTLGGNFVADFDGMRSEFFNDIGGDAGLTKAGTGALVLWGQNRYTGTTTITRGTVELYGSVAGDILIQDDGVLSADGGVAERSVDNFGTLAAKGNGLHIQGSYFAFRPEARLATQLGTPLTVDGLASLGNSALEITKPNDAYVVKSRETALKARIVAGRFGTVSADPSLLYTVSPDYSTADQVDLDVARSNVATVAHDLYGGQAGRLGAAQAIETAFEAADAKVLGADSNVSDAFIQRAARLQSVDSAAQLAAALDSVSGQIHASSQALGFQQSQAVNRALSNRVDQLALAGARSGVWMQMMGGAGKLKQSGFAGADTRLYGGQLGVDHRVTDDGILGLSLTWSDAKADFDHYGGQSRSQGTGLSLYGRYGAEIGPYVSARAGHEWRHADVKRDILAGGAERVASSRNDRVTALYAEIGHAFAFDSGRVTPFVGVSYDHLARGAIDEDGSAFALQARKKSYVQGAGQLGLRLQSSPLDWAGGSTTLSAYGAYRYGNPTRLDFTAAFAGAPDASFEVQGIGLPRHTGWLGLGASSQLADDVSWYASYDAQFGPGGLTNNVLAAGLRYRFQ